jgi:hypothetical protein
MRLPDQHDRGTLDAPDRRLDRIVVGVDFTESSLAVAQWVGRHLARAAELLVHVTPMAMMPNVARAGSNRLAIVDGRSSDRVRSLRGALRGLASLIVGTRTAVDVRVGDPATQLAAYANMVDADLVVVAGSTKYHVAPHDEAATTHQLLRCVGRPVLVTRNVHATPTTVLAVVADDRDASPVLAAAGMVAIACAARVARLRVTTRAATESTGRLEHRLRATDDSPAKFNAAAAEAERVRVILDAARELRAEIVAVGTHTPAGETTRDDGDAAAHMLVRTTSCSVLVVPEFTKVLPAPPHLEVEGHSRRYRHDNPQTASIGRSRVDQQVTRQSPNSVTSPAGRSTSR